MIHRSSLLLAQDGTRRLEAYRAAPEVPRRPGLVILHDMFGIGAPFRELADDFAAAGHPVLVPNLFWRADPDDGVLSYETGHQAAWARLERFDFGAATADVQLALTALRRPPASAKAAVLGFCFSGRLAFLAAARTDADAVAALYSLGISRDADEAPRIACPVELHYGLADEHVPRAEIDRVAAIAAAQPKIAIHLYEGAGHSFFNPVRPMFDPAAAALARRRIDALIAGLEA